MRFDKLGVQDAILRIEILAIRSGSLAEQQFLPWLDRVAKNESYLHMARLESRGARRKHSGGLK